MRKKTVLIPIFDGAVGRNILRTDALKVLKNHGIRVVLIPPYKKIDYYKKEFADGEAVVVEEAPCWRHDTWQFILAEIYTHSIPTFFMKIRQTDWYWNKKRYFSYFGARILSLAGGFSIWRKFLLWFESLQPVPDYVEEIFNRWQPDVVFAPTMIPRDEIAFIKLAKRYGKVSIGMVKSWDNLTSKSFLRVFPDRIIVHNEIIAKEAEEIYEYPAKNIFISGIPQFDKYADPNFIESRDSFFKKIGADPSKKLILYAPAGDWMNPHDKDILQLLLDSIEKGELGEAQVLLRLHPGYSSKTDELRHPRLIIERPGKQFGDLKQFEFDEDDMAHLASTMRWSDVTINTASTLTIEAAIFDKPVILIGFDGEKKLPYWQSVIRYYDREHYATVMRSGGSRLVKSREDFVPLIKQYLAAPDLDREGRKRIVAEQCWKIDGKSGERIGNFIISQLHN